MRPRRSPRPLWLGLGLLLCLAAPLFRPLLTGFERGLLDPGDSRLAVFVLERNTEWLLGGGGENAPWDLGIFFPRTDTLLYSDTFFGQTPFWAALRWLGCDRVVAFHLLLGCFLALNFLAAERLLSRTVRLPPAPAFLGALLFALGSPRLAHLFHVQLVAQFPLILFLSAIAEALDPAGSPSQLRQVATGLAIGGSWALLFHFTPYMAWFVALAALFALGLALLFRAGRTALHRLFTRRLATCMAAAAVAGALVLPVLVRYLEAARAVGVRPDDQAVLLLLSPSAWLYQGPWSILYGRFSSWLPISAHPYESELRLGLGWVTSALVLYGLWLGRRRPLVFWTVLPVSALCLLLSKVGGFEV